VKDAVEKGDLLDHMVFICADNVSEIKLKRWVLKNFHRRLDVRC
jgi:hypothetical protein